MDKFYAKQTISHKVGGLIYDKTFDYLMEERQLWIGKTKGKNLFSWFQKRKNNLYFSSTISDPKRKVSWPQGIGFGFS